MNKYTVQQFGTMGTFYVMRNDLKHGKAFNYYIDAANSRDALNCLQHKRAIKLYEKLLAD